MKWLHKSMRRYNKRQKLLSSQIEKRVKVFAWRPIKTNTQIVVWLEYVWEDNHVRKDNGQFFSSTTIYYIHEKGQV